MTDPMELVGRLERNSKQTITRYCGDLNGAIVPHDLLTEAAACIREMVEWRPIETAPRDGIWVVLRIAGDPKCGFWDDSDGGDWYDSEAASSSLTAFGDRPTHWLPLPPAPGAED